MSWFTRTGARAVSAAPAALRALAVAPPPGALTLIVSLCLALALALPATAGADFSPATLLSGTQRLQFDEANAPALSADGRYAVFQGVLADVPGVYRRDLQTGVIEMVAGADASDPQKMCNAVAHPLVACDAAAPSVSADGRHVAFTTTADLDPANEPPGDRQCPEVYVRDMSVKPAGQGAYTLAAALNGTSKGILYSGGCAAPPSSGFNTAGAQATPGAALSADGRHVVFTVLSKSNLAGPETPLSQVAVRNLETDTTTLVSATPGGQATPKGGAFPSEDSRQRVTPPVGPKYLTASTYGDQLTASSAAISADGSTVAWLGMNVPAQVPSSAAELKSGKGPNFPERDPLGSEAEPLWRRLADGQGAVTRRLLAGAGLDLFYSEVADSNDPVLTGSFVGKHDLVFIPPALSADGGTVAVLASAPTPAGEATFQRSGLPALQTDAYVVRIGENPASAPEVTALTTIPSYAASLAAIGDVKDIAISPDGTRVAFDTTRTQLALPRLTLISPPSSFTGVSQTYEANLALGTLQRVTTAYDGSEPNGGAGLLAFSDDRQGTTTTLAFASQATNLFFGDAVAASEVYAVHELPAGVQPMQQRIGAPPALVALPGPAWVLRATATAQADGSVLVVAQTPGAGRLAVRAAAQLPAHVVKAARHRARAGKARKLSSMTVSARVVAQAATATARPTEIGLRMRVSRAYRALVAGRSGLYAVLRVTFAAPGRRTLVEEVPVTFRVMKHRRAAHRRVKR